MLKAVLDTNVILSAFISPKGTCSRIIEYLAAFKFVACLSKEMLGEINEAIRYSKISKNRSYTDKEIERFLHYLFNFTMLVDGKVQVEYIKDDPDDDKVFACAVEAKADFVVSGDNHLLSLGEYEHIPILKPAEFLKLIQSYEE